MALRAMTQPEFSGRLAYLLRRSGMKAMALTKAIDKKPGYISWLMNDARFVPAEVIAPIACAISEHLKGAVEETALFSYLAGLTDVPPDIPGSLISVAA